MCTETISTTPHRILNRLAFLVVGLLLCFSSATQAALYIKFTGIDGEASEKDHKSWSELASVNWGVSYSVAARRPAFMDLSWNQQLDKSFPKLFTAIATGKHLNEATVDFTTIFGDARAPVYFQMKFREVLLTSLNLSGGGSGDANFSGSFAYSWIKMAYTEFDASGKKIGVVEAEYDLKKGSGGSDLAALLEVYELGMSGPPVVPGVPEPSTYAMMLGGIAAVGFVARRRKNA